MRSLVTLMLLASPVLVVAAPDCTSCHASPPVDGEHMPMLETSIDICTTCHAASATDTFFRVVHETHQGIGLDCSFCHSEADNHRQERLESILSAKP